MIWVSSLLCFTCYCNKILGIGCGITGIVMKFTFSLSFYFASHQTADALRHVIFQSFHVPIGPMETLLFL
ncbi:hypothetical protein BDV33DRAFT_52263 [Aspergillus novoparasiticus]|uniref:Uncharacterized protein n=1 Tax=Aspergillus novoparasiticus TaxID=986946 RepID=A0A5N6E8E9_9EURO|nr:hypothetical protein BDV33DRAFT_52263 [Aspergillus novoparasiticus]